MKIAKPNRSAASKKSTRSVLRTASPVPETQIDPAIALQRVTALPTTHHNPTHLQALQRAVGNHAVTHILNRRTRQIQRSVGANHAIDLVVQRAIEAGKLNLVGEKHAYTAKEKATEAEEKAFIKDRYGFSDDQFWDETTFTYDDEGKTKHGDPPKLRAQKFALDALEPLEEAEERYKAYIGAVGNNQE
jgi:hypothetical protein